MESPINTSATLVLAVALLFGGFFVYAKCRWLALSVREASPERFSWKWGERFLPAARAFRRRPKKEGLPVGVLARDREPLRGEDDVSGGRPLRGSSGVGHSGRQPPEWARFRKRRVRAAVALLGLLGLLTTIIGGLCALFGAFPVWVPIFGAAAVCTSVSVLRLTAPMVRPVAPSHSYDAAGAGQGATVPVSESLLASEGQAPSAPAAPSRGLPTPVAPAERLPLFSDDAPFDFQSTPAPGTTPASGAAEAPDLPSEPEDQAGPTSTPWTPSQVPPSPYMGAPKAVRPSVEPLECSAAPVPRADMSIRADQRQRAQGGLRNAGPAPSSRQAPPNLDDVLQRRRA